MDATPITAAEFETLAGLDVWVYAAGQINAEFTLGSFGAAGRFVAEIAALADAADHHPDLALRYPGTVRVVLTTHSAGSLTTLDVDLARQVTARAAELGATASTA